MLHLLIIFTLSGAANAMESKMFDADKISINWKLLENKPQKKAVFTFCNNSQMNFPAKGWTIYFSSSQRIDSDKTARNDNIVNIVHLNGDVYRLTPTKSFHEIKPGEKVCAAYFFNGQILNCSAAPSGLYIVWDASPGKGFLLSDFNVFPIKDPNSGFISPAGIYRKDLHVQDIPESELTKIFPTPYSYRELPAEFRLSADVRIIFDSAFTREATYLSKELSTLLGKNVLSAVSETPISSCKQNESVFQKSCRKSSYLNHSVKDAICTNARKLIILRKVETLENPDLPYSREGYQLKVSSDKIEISAITSSGIFYGIQSLKSLMPPSSWKNPQNSIRIPSVEVSDFPRFEYRSLLLDVARNFKTKEKVLKVLDLMALYKLNVLHFHLIDDEGWRLEIPSLPELTEVGGKRGHSLDSSTMLLPSYGAGPEPGKTLASGYYTRSDFIEILKYADERHIQVIPEIESPGHSRSAIKAMDARYKRLMNSGKREEAEFYLLHDVNDRSKHESAQLWNDNIMCVALPSVYRFLEKVVDEIVSIYNEAEVPLSTIHFGGDEVPAGSWEKSPACRKLLKTDTSLSTIDDLWYYFYSRINSMLKARNLYLSGWEEVALRKTLLDGEKKMIPNPDFVGENFHVHVWNNMIGWGAEDLPYKLANAGYKVVLSCVSNNYFDLAYSKSPDEPGYYWGGFQDIDKPFYFVPYDYYKTTREDAAGNPADPANFFGKERLTDFGKSNIVGIQGLLWGENVRSNELLDYLLLPKLLGLAERAWAKDPSWGTGNGGSKTDQNLNRKLYDQDWSKFVNTVGKREMPRLDSFAGGYKYRIPPVGAIKKNGRIMINIQIPGLVLRYTNDGSEPTVQSKQCRDSISEKGTLKIRAFDSQGRGGKITTIEN
ncbi:MAG: carbohydate-binding domain-containing protein [Candidatus Riflebacteria bacterium]|nr:carbohydate-binding domain-containing protein [Candidatus Riflebacteria bacterium]